LYGREVGEYDGAEVGEGVEEGTRARWSLLEDLVVWVEDVGVPLLVLEVEGVLALFEGVDVGESVACWPCCRPWCWRGVRVGVTILLLVCLKGGGTIGRAAAGAVVLPACC